MALFTKPVFSQSIRINQLYTFLSGNQYEKYYRELVVTDFPSRLPPDQFLSCSSEIFSFI
jgi:hypothetical protein